MAAYMAERIMLGKLNYNAVVAKYPQFKEDIDKILVLEGYAVNEDGTVTKIEG